MKNLKMYCLSMHSNHLDVINKLGYCPVGLGEDNFSKEWLRDNIGDNISTKNKYYGEYTFHYWLWKNYLDQIEEGWIGFCQYRKFWTAKDKIKFPLSLEALHDLVLKAVPPEYEEFETILGEPSFINKLKMMKLVKNGLKMIITNPAAIMNKNKRNIKFHFDMWHGRNYLNQAIEQLDKNDRGDFNYFVNTESSFNPHNMFICRSKKLLKKYYEAVFPWLERCERIFGFEKLAGYGQIRIYGFLAERFMSYWFQKNTKYKIMPIIFYDVTKNLN